MHATSIQKALDYDRGDVSSRLGPQDDGGSSTVVEVLWRRRSTLAATIALFVLASVAYLLVSPKIYSSTAQVYVEQGGQSVLGERSDAAARSENFLYTQAEVVKSSAVLSQALAEIGAGKLKTFAGITGDPVDWLKNTSDFSVEVGKKGDVLNISMESPYPDEAAGIVNSVVKAFVAEQTRQRQATGGEMVKILRAEEADLQKERESVLGRIEALKQQSGILSFKDEKQNTALAHLAALSNSYTTAQLATVDLRAELQSAQTILDRPEAISSYVQSMQTKSRDAGDKEYDELRSNLSQLMLSVTANGTLAGSNNPRMIALNADVAMLKKRIADKEKAIVQARVQDLAMQLASAEDKERQLKAALDSEQKANLALVPQAETYAKLEADADRIQKQCDQIDARITQVDTNSTSAGALNVQVLDNARVASRPIKPRKPLVLAIAAFAGLLFGSTLCMLREWQDPRLRRPDEVVNALGVPVVAIVPRIPPQLTVADRGQLVHIDPMSPAAEAYRALRTAVNFGPVRDARTIAIVSPLPGDGKSTTASNLAIALAEAGHRTLLIDADMRRPVQHDVFGIKTVGGLSSVLNGGEKLRDVIHPTGVSGLYLLPSGPVPRNPAELIGGRQFQQVMEALGTAFERIVIDSPPLAPVTDGRILASMAHATLVVLRMNQSVRKVSVTAIDGLKKVGANILGAVVNDVVLGPDYGYYHSGSFAPDPSRRIASTVSAGRVNGNGHANGNHNGHRNGNGNGKSVSGSELSYLLPEDHLALGDTERPAEGRLRLGSDD